MKMKNTLKKYGNKTNIILTILLVLSSILLILSFALKFTIPAAYGSSSKDSPIVEIKNNDKIETTFLSPMNNLESLTLKATSSGNIKEDSIYVSIYDEQGNKIYYNDLARVRFFDLTYYNFKFDRVKNSMGKNFKLVIEAKELPEDYVLKLYDTQDAQEAEMTTINGEKIEQDLSITQYGYVATYFYKGLFTIAIFILMFILFRYNFKNNQKLKDYLLKKKKVFFIQFISSLIAGYSFLNILYKTHYESSFPIIYYGLFMIGVIILLFIYGIYLGDKKLKKEDLFLLLAIPISIMYYTFILCLCAPDDFYHYKLAYKVSLFNFFSFDVSIPKNIVVPGRYNQIIMQASYQNLTGVRAGGYHPFLYLFSAIGIGLSRLLNTSVVVGMYFGRMANLLVFLIIGYYIIKKIPFGKWLMIVYLLNPMFIQQATSFSADSMINIFSMLFIAYILYIRYDKNKIEKKDFLILLGSYLFVFIGKYAYVFLGLLFFLVWKELKEFIKKYKKFAIISFLIFLLISCSWLIYTKVILKIVSNSTSTIPKYIIPQKTETKLGFILKNPMNFLSIYCKTLLNRLYFYILSLFGFRLGMLNIEINVLYIAVYIFLLFFSIIIETTTKESDKKTKIINIIIFVLTFHIILVGLYLGWGITNDVEIEGIQGRYFIPITILLLLPLVKKNQKLNMKNIEFIFPMILIINHIFIIKDIITFFLI